MVSSSKEETLIYNIKLSSVGPGKVTGQDVIHEPTNMDLAMKLHYLRGVYYFKSQASNGLTTMKIKESMFMWLNHYYVTCGRFRRSESGRPYIKCNDCGARFIEAQCDKTIDEWMEIMNKDGNIEIEKLLVYSQVIGPELPFSPLVLIQLTKFKCGGFTVGLSWAHVLGDAFFAAEYMNMWGHFLAGHRSLPHPPVKPAKTHSVTEPAVADQSLAVKRVGPVGDHWFVPNDTKMVSFSLNVTPTQLSWIQSNLRGENDAVDVPSFEALCGVIWHCVARVKNGMEPTVVTLCRNDTWREKMGSFTNNNQGISSVRANFSISETKPTELVSLLMNQFVDEKGKIEDEMGRENGLLDFVVYGANLTFVDLTNAGFYDLKINEENPSYVSYIVDGVGEEGVVLVLPQPKNVGKDCNQGLVVTVILPENQVSDVKFELEKEFSFD